METTHPFERSGLGKAPFRCVGMRENVYSAAPGHSQPGGSCQYCGTGIRYEFIIKSADGKSFVVGSDCVAKTEGVEPRLKLEVKREKLAFDRQKRRAKAAAGRKAQADKWAAEIEARRPAFQAEHGALMARAAEYIENRPEDVWPGFIEDVYRKAKANAQLSPGQAQALTEALDKFDSYTTKKAASRHVGKLGERIERAVTVEYVTGFSRPKFGAPWLNEYVSVVTMRDEEGNALVSMGRFRAEKGEKLVVRGTVKDHTEYKGEKQTKLQRVTAVCANAHLDA